MRRAVTGWVLVIVPILALNLGYLLLAFPRIAATSWDSAGRLLGQLGSGGAVATTWVAVQLLLLLLPAVGLTYTFGRTARMAGRGAWRWSAGSAGRRLVTLSGLVLVVGGLALAWWPDGRVTPYREGERGTVQQQVRELKAVGNGRPLLRSPQEAQQRLPAVPAGTSPVLDPTPSAAPSASPAAVPSGTASPSAVAEPSFTPSPSPEANNDATSSPSPTPSPAGFNTPSPSPTP